jgi:hypothetical protein
MARREARLLVSIWDDPDFLALSAMAQRLFMFLISQPDLAHDGVMAVRIRRWSKKAAGLTPAQVSESLDELAAARFVIVDDDAEELVIRSFIRGDKVYRQPNVLRAAADHLATVSSPIIRATVRAELTRIQADDQEIPEKSGPVITEMLEALGNPSPNPTPNPSGKGSQLRPGERGVVTAVSSDSPYPVASQKSPYPVPRGGAARRPRAQARERGTRLPDDFAVTAELVAWASENTPGIDGRYETAKFVDYWRGKTGQAATKLDWPGTWRNWMRKAHERAGPAWRTPGARPTADDKAHGFVERGRRLQALRDQTEQQTYDIKELGA